MTAYLENNAISPSRYKAAELTPAEREAALKAIKFYRSLTLPEIENLLEANHKADVAAAERRNRRNRIGFFALTGVSVATIALLCIFFVDLRYILIPLAISFEAGLLAHSLISKERIKK